MHSSRMRTARSLTTCRNVVEGGHAWQGGACMAGGVNGRGVCGGGHAWQGVHG